MCLILPCVIFEVRIAACTGQSIQNLCESPNWTHYLKHRRWQGSKKASLDGAITLAKAQGLVVTTTLMQLLRFFSLFAGLIQGQSVVRTGHAARYQRSVITRGAGPWDSTTSQPVWLLIRMGKPQHRNYRGCVILCARTCRRYPH